MVTSSLAPHIAQFLCSNQGPVFGAELPVALQIEVALHVADRKNETNLPAGGCDLRLEAADAIAGSAVARLWNSILVVS